MLLQAAATLRDWSKGGLLRLRLRRGVCDPSLQFANETCAVEKLKFIDQVLGRQATHGLDITCLDRWISSMHNFRMSTLLKHSGQHGRGGILITCSFTPEDDVEPWPSGLALH